MSGNTRKMFSKQIGLCGLFVGVFLIISGAACAANVPAERPISSDPVMATAAPNAVAVAPAIIGSPIPGGEYFYVYSDQDAKDNHFIPSGFMGDTNCIKIKDKQQLNPHSGKTCIRFTYTPDFNADNQQKWAGVQWQNPQGNWGNEKGGFDLREAKRLTFWARGAKGGEVIDTFQVGGISNNPYPDSDKEGIGPVTLTKEWKLYTIDLADSNLSYISGGFAWAASAERNPNGITFYLDDIRYEMQ